MTNQQPDLDEQLAAALGPIARMFMPRPLHLAARAAIGAALDGDDIRLVATLDALDREQLGALVTATVALGVTASRRRETLADDGQADEHDPMPEWERRLLAEKRAAGWETEAGRYCDNADYWRKRAEQAEARTKHWQEATQQYAADLTLATERADQAERDLTHARSAGASYCRQRDEQRERAEQAEVECNAVKDALDRTSRHLADGQAATENELWRLLHRLAETEIRAINAEATVNRARARVEQWRYTPDRKRAAAELTGILDQDQPAEQPTPADVRDLIEKNPQILRRWLRNEMRRDPAWWRRTLRTEIRTGHLPAEDLRRAGITGPE